MRQILFFILALALTACTLNGGSFAETGLHIDMRDSIAAQGIISAPPVDCSTTAVADGYCTMSLSQEDVNRYINNIGLNRVNLAELVPAAGGCITMETFSGSPAVTLYEIFGSPPPLTLPNGNQFNSILVFYRTDTQATCIQVTYAN
jgi:hypothetical protein